MIQTSVAISPICVCFSAFFSRRAYHCYGRSGTRTQTSIPSMHAGGDDDVHSSCLATGCSVNGTHLLLSYLWLPVKAGFSMTSGMPYIAQGALG